jgi:2-C-methyl-D-erythritol 2,4-cyclodiphosphate synthase
MRTGFGYDAHRLVEGRKLILGGEEIPFEKGLLGHSDADVIIHAVCDALLGAAGLGDIGIHFPDSDPAFKGIASLSLLEQVNKMLAQKGWQVGNLDITLVAQEPKIAPYRSTMEQNIATALGIAPDCVNVKATTTEHMGFAGKGEGMAAYCAALITKIDRPEK